MAFDVPAKLNEKERPAIVSMQANEMARPPYKQGTLYDGSRQNSRVGRIASKTRAKIIGNQCTKFVRQLSADPKLALRVEITPFVLTTKPAAEAEEQPRLPITLSGRDAWKGFNDCKLDKITDPEMSNRLYVSIVPTEQSPAFRDPQMVRKMSRLVAWGMYTDAEGKNMDIPRTIEYFNNGILQLESPALFLEATKTATASSGADFTVVRTESFQP